jgi:hypothetical protein
MGRLSSDCQLTVTVSRWSAAFVLIWAASALTVTADCTPARLSRITRGRWRSARYADSRCCGLETFMLARDLIVARSDSVEPNFPVVSRSWLPKWRCFALRVILAPATPASIGFSTTLATDVLIGES